MTAGEGLFLLVLVLAIAAACCSPDVGTPPK